MTLLSGLDRLVARDFDLCRKGPFGVLTHQCAVDREARHLLAHLLGRGLVPAAVFSPEHGLWSTHQDMETVPGRVDPVFGLPVTSLYGDAEATLGPAREMLGRLDLLLVDLQDVGVRYYTYAATVARVLRAAAGTACPVLVLDRPNPIDGLTVEGGPRREEMISYVGELPVPNRHGLTLGELARLVVREERLDVQLEVMPMQGWDRGSYFDRTGLLWVPPSPNMPALETAIAYPGLCLLEGTNVSEARGTTTPFTLFGAPWVEPDALVERLRSEQVCAGVALTPAVFRPMFGKFGGEVCRGLRLHMVDRPAFRPFAFGLALVKWLLHLHPRQFAWRTQAYEFVTDRLAIDLLLGDAALRGHLEAGTAIRDLLPGLDEYARTFAAEQEPFLLYR
jgi:uncharacterized protein YbbC (DUF1343 family)